MILLILLPHLLVVASACLEDSLIINGLINGRFAYQGHNLPQFLSKSHVTVTGVNPANGVTALNSHGLSDINGVHGVGSYNNLINGNHGPTGLDGLTFQSTQELSGMKGPHGVSEITKVDEFYDVNPGHGEVDEILGPAEQITHGAAFGERDRHPRPFNNLRNFLPRFQNSGHHEHQSNWINRDHQYPEHAITEKKIISKETTVDIKPHSSELYNRHEPIAGQFVEEVTDVETHPMANPYFDREVVNTETISSTRPDYGRVNAYGNVQKIIPGAGRLNEITKTETIVTQPGHRQGQFGISVNRQFPVGGFKGGLLRPLVGVGKFALNQLSGRNVGGSLLGGIEQTQYPQAGQNIAGQYLGGLDQNQFIAGQNIGGQYLNGMDQTELLSGQNIGGQYSEIFDQTQFPLGGTDQSHLLIGSGGLGSAVEEIDEDSHFLGGLGQSVPNNIQSSLGQAGRWHEAGSVGDELSVADGQQNFFQQPYLIGGQIPYSVPGYMNQYGIYQQFGEPVPSTYPLPVPAYGAFEAESSPVELPHAGKVPLNIEGVENFGHPGLVAELGEEHHYDHQQGYHHNPLHQEQNHHEDQYYEPAKDLTIFSRFKGDDDEKVNKTDASDQVEKHSVENKSEHNVTISHPVDVRNNISEGHPVSGGDQKLNANNAEFVSDIKESKLPVLDPTPVAQNDSENEIASSESETLVKRTTVVEDPRVVTLTIKIPPKTTTKEVEVKKTQDGYESKESAVEHEVESENNGKLHVSMHDTKNSEEGVKEIDIHSLGGILNLIPK